MIGGYMLLLWVVMTRKKCAEYNAQNKLRTGHLKLKLRVIPWNQSLALVLPAFTQYLKFFKAPFHVTCKGNQNCFWRREILWNTCSAKEKILCSAILRRIFVASMICSFASTCLRYTQGKEIWVIPYLHKKLSPVHSTKHGCIKNAHPTPFARSERSITKKKICGAFTYRFIPWPITINFNFRAYFSVRKIEK